MDKTKEMIIDFSKTFSVELPVFIDSKVIERVCTFEYLGTFFSEDLQWHKNSEENFKIIKSRFNAFSKFKSFNLSSTQCNHFIHHFASFIV